MEVWVSQMSLEVCWSMIISAVPVQQWSHERMSECSLLVASSSVREAAAEQEAIVGEPRRAGERPDGARDRHEREQPEQHTVHHHRKVAPFVAHLHREPWTVNSDQWPVTSGSEA